MPFSVIHSNDIVEVRQQLLGDRDVAVVCVFGNTATWTQIHDDWPESCAPYADICINVRDLTYTVPMDYDMNELEQRNVYAAAFLRIFNIFLLI